MTNLWTPDFWNNVGVVGIAVLAAFAFVWALATERLVLGRQYRAAVARADKYDDANRDLTQALITKNASEQASTAILTAIREEFAAKGGT